MNFVGKIPRFHSMRLLIELNDIFEVISAVLLAGQREEKSASISFHQRRCELNFNQIE